VDDDISYIGNLYNINKYCIIIFYINYFSNMRPDHKKLIDEICALEKQYESAKDLFSFKEAKKNFNILIYESNKTDAENILSVLHSNNIRRLVLRKRGDNWLDDIDTYSPRLILISMSLRTKSGFEVVREIVQYEKFEHIPIILLSKDATEVERSWAIKCGAKAMVKKPVNNDYTFIEILTAILRTTMFYSFDYDL